MNALVSRLQSFLFGFFLPWQSFKLIVSRPKLIFWSLLPLLITLSLYLYVITHLQDQLQLWMSSVLLHWNLSPEGGLAFFLRILTRIFLFFVSAVTFSYLSALVSCPFNDFLAEATERALDPPLSAEVQLEWKTRLGYMGIDMLKSLIAAGATLAFFLFSWVPVINLGVLVLSCILIAFQFVSYPQTRRGETIEQSIHFLMKHFFACFGFGLSSSILFSIPILSCLGLPLAVVGGTLLYARSSVTRSSLTVGYFQLK